MQDASQGENLVGMHRSALKAYMFFLHWASQQSEAEDSANPAPAAAAVAAGGNK